jgi:hypothetical protein
MVLNRTAVLLLTLAGLVLNAQEAKKPGVLRIGVVLPEAQMGQGQAGQTNVAEPVRGELLKYLSGPTLEVVPLTSRISFQIDAEAKSKECDYVLYSAVTQKPGSTAAKKGFFKGAVSAARVMPMMGAAHGAGAYVATEAASSAISGIAEASAMVKSQDEWGLTYRLIGPNGALAAENTTTAKASRDGEDIISPMLRKTAEAVLGKVLGK